MRTEALQQKVKRACGGPARWGGDQGNASSYPHPFLPPDLQPMFLAGSAQPELERIRAL